MAKANMMEEVETAENFELSAEALPETEETPKPEMTQDDIRLVEAILFASSTAVSESMIAERFPEDRAVLIPEILAQLQQKYEGGGVNLVQRDKRWALRTATDLGERMRLEREQPKKFTRAAMETMAVVAYHQPVTRAEIENIRGVATSPGALDALLEAGWIKTGKRREVPGRPVTWLTTQAFLDHFGLEKLEDLPGMDELKAAGLLDKRPAIEAMPTADLFDEAENKADLTDPNEVTDEDLMGKPTSKFDDENETSDLSEFKELEVGDEKAISDIEEGADIEDADDEDDDLDDDESSEDDDDDDDNDEEDEEDDDDDDDDDDEKDED